MREILFKGKRTDNGEWVEGRLLADDVIVPKGQEFETEDIYIIADNLMGFEVIPETVGQYTGLTDKNGKKIFEGDIVENEWNGRKHLVEYYEDRGGYFPFACGDGCGCCETDVEIPESTIIIGNIHDNPELLKAGD